MNGAIVHRGPDGGGFFVQDGISLGHRRLSIIDLSEAAGQPMTNNRGDLTIVYNGELYNFKELKKELESFYTFKTQSDTEVALAAYEKWGAEAVKKFNGIFALAVWDKAKRELFLARDPVGVKPLYYYFDGKRFVFSSEIKAILEHTVARVLDMESFNHYFRVLYTPEPKTMFKGIYKFPKASFGYLREGRFYTKNYERENFGERFEGDWAGTLYDAIFGAVKRQMVSDRPVGLYLSGGIDSSALLHCMKELRGEVKTFSVGFDLKDGEQREKFNLDFYLARRTAEHYGAKHHEIMISYEDVVDILPKAVWHLDEPVSNATIIPMFFLSRLAKKEVSVVLEGDGGDELFGGYERYRLSRIMSFYQNNFPRWSRRLASRLNKNYGKLDIPAGVDRYALFLFLKDNVLSRVLSKNFFNPTITRDFFDKTFFKNSGGKNFESVFLDTDRKSWLADEALSRADKMSMAHGLEARVPILDKEVVNLAKNIPISEKVGFFNTKIILKKAFKNKLPNYLYNQPKRGFFSPGAKWLRNEKIYAFVKEALSRDYYSGTDGLFDWRGVETMLKGHVESEEYNLTAIWAVLTFQIWAKLYNIKVE